MCVEPKWISCLYVYIIQILNLTISWPYKKNLIFCKIDYNDIMSRKGLIRNSRNNRIMILFGFNNSYLLFL